MLFEIKKKNKNRGREEIPVAQFSSTEVFLIYRSAGRNKLLLKEDRKRGYCGNVDVSFQACCILCKLLIGGMRNKCARNSMCKICVTQRTLCAMFAQDFHKLGLSYVQDFLPNAQNLRKIVLISPMRNICARFAQYCIFPQCAVYA